MQGDTTVKSNAVGGGFLSKSTVPPSGRTYQNKYAWVVWAISVFFVLFQFCIQLTSGEIVEGLMKSFTLTALGGGFLASAYYYIYVALQTPAGILMDRFGPRRLLTMGAFILFFGSILFGMSHQFGLALVGRLLMGGGAAFAFVGCLNLIARWFPAERFGVMTAIVETAGVIGSLVGGVALAALVQHTGWRACMEAAGVVAILIGVANWSFVRDTPPNVTNIIVPPKNNFWSDLKVLLKKKITWINAIYSGIIFSVVTVFIALWAVPFIQAEHHLGLTMATLVCNMVFAGIAIGSPLIGWLDAYTDLRRAMLIGCALGAAVLMSMVVYFPELSNLTVMVLMFLLGVCCSSYVITFIIGNEIATPNTRSSSIGFVNTLSVGTAPILQPIVGLFLYLLSKHISHHGVAHYSVTQYQIALAIIPLLLLVAAYLGKFIPRPA